MTQQQQETGIILSPNEVQQMIDSLSAQIQQDRALASNLEADLNAVREQITMNSANLNMLQALRAKQAKQIESK